MAGLGALIVLGWAALPALRKIAALDPNPALCGALGLAWILLAGVDLGRRAHILNDQHQLGWLAATPWPQAMRQRARRRTLTRAALLWSLASGGVALSLLALRPQGYPGWLQCCVGLALLGLPAAVWAWQSRAPAARTAHARGRLPTPAWIMAGPNARPGWSLLDAGWHRAAPRALRGPLLLMLMLVPGGLGGRAALGVLLGIGIWLAALQAWTRYRDSVFQVSRWLQALPLSPRRLGTALGMALARRMAWVFGLLGLAAGIAGVPAASLLPVLLLGAATVLWLALLVLQYRHHPDRYRRVSAVHGVGLLLGLQSLPWLALLLWLGSVGLALRSIHRRALPRPGATPPDRSRAA